MTTDQQNTHNDSPEPRITLHLTPLDVWNAQTDAETYVPEPFGREGFIHCTDGEDRALAVGNRYYTEDPRPYCLLEIERARLTAPVIYEDQERIYPHIYGRLNKDAVLAVRSVRRGEEGRFLGFGEPIVAS